MPFLGYVFREVEPQNNRLSWLDDGIIVTFVMIIIFSKHLNILRRY